MTPPPAARRVLTAALPAVAFALLAVAVGHAAGRPFGVDRALHAWAVEHRPAVAASLGRLLTATGTGVIPYLLALLAGWAACRPGAPPRRRAALAGVCLLVLALGQLLRAAVMDAVARPRPPLADWATPASGHAFPSGHTTTSAITAGLLVWALARSAAGASARILSALCLCWAAAVGASRVYLGVHWPTDVLGGWLLASVWLAVVLPPLTLLADRSGPGPG